MSDHDTEGYVRYGGDCVCGAVYTYMGIPEPGHFAPDCPIHGVSEPLDGRGAE